MARSQNSFNKKEREKKKAQKRKEKEAKKLERKESGVDSSMDNMMVYLDADGNFVDTPPDETEKTEVDENSIQISTPKSAPIDFDAERRGKVTFYNDQKGYGFIEQDGTQEKFFLHHTNLTGHVEESTKVKFKIKKGEKGFDAIEVKVV